MNDITISRPKLLWQTKNPLLGSGQYGIEDETGKVKRGDGVAHWNALPYLNVAPYTIPEDEFSTPMAAGMAQIVVHGTDASVARPSTSGPVVWYGSVSPTNSNNTTDVWVPVA